MEAPSFYWDSGPWSCSVLIKDEIHFCAKGQHLYIAYGLVWCDVVWYDETDSTDELKLRVPEYWCVNVVEQ